MSVFHYIVSSFGDTVFDGVNLSIFVLDFIPTTTELLMLLAAKQPFSHSIFALPTADNPENTTTPSYTLRSITSSPVEETNVSPFTSLAAAHVIFAQHNGKLDELTIIENTRKLLFPRPESKFSEQIRCHVEVPEQPVLWTVEGLARVMLMELFGIVRRGAQMEYVEHCRTLVVYDVDSGVEELRGIRPKESEHGRGAAERLNVHTVVVCVSDEGSGGLFTRAFLPLHAYREVPMPVSATPYLHNIDPESPGSLC
ncbi:hypothetical protein LPJ53_005967 [Coemansia erecta]|uniref:Uncharacterized protein n=1 Tax=Coemansia erecta TaxID=147472 RepID=A0A9W7XVF7_9FUNG|nr:hypothetical protein LPJ53_005967 [Coemansia erecta]